MNKKNKVIIIEDNFDDFKDVKSQLQDEYDCYPKFSEEQFREFRGMLELCFDGGNDEEIGKRYVRDVIRKIKKPTLFIIDYQLKDDDHKLKISGDKFYLEFVKSTKVPSLFITRWRTDHPETSRDLSLENNHLLEFTKSSDGGPKELLFKSTDLSRVEFKDALKKSIKSLISRQIIIDPDTL